MRKIKPFLIIPTATILALGISGCNIVDSLIGNTHSTDLEVGQCLKDLGGNIEDVNNVPVVDCAKPHLYEVYHEVEIGGDTLPTTSELDSRSETACTGEGFSNYVGVPFEESEYNITYLMPSKDTWEQGDREISCLIAAADQNKTTGSVKDSGK